MPDPPSHRPAGERISFSRLAFATGLRDRPLAAGDRHWPFATGDRARPVCRSPAPTNRPRPTARHRTAIPVAISDNISPDDVPEVRRAAAIVRDMTIDDLAPVFHLGEVLFKSDLYPSLYRTWEAWEVTGHYNTDPEFCSIAEVDGGFAGFLLGTVIEKDGWTYGYIQWLGVHPDFQRLGVADTLVDKFVERTISEGARTILIDTDPANEPAVRFFTRKGFGNTRQHIYMSLDLTGHDYYGKLLDYERDKTERASRKLRRRRLANS